MRKTQLVVVGGGPGGYVAAFRAADLGMEVTLVDEEADPGGVCLYRGCIPSKALLHAARVIEETREMRAHGIQFGEPTIDLPQLGGWKDKVVGQLTGGLSGLAKAFFYAGARALLVSHWPVQSDAATALTTRMFQTIKDNPLVGRAEALRQSMMALATNPQTAHPFFWAPFVVVGEGGQ